MPNENNSINNDDEFYSPDEQPYRFNDKSLSLDIAFLREFNHHHPTLIQRFKAALDIIKLILTRPGMAKGATDAAIYYNTIISFLVRANFLTQAEFQHNTPLYRSMFSLTSTGALLLGMSTAIAYSKREDSGELKDLHNDPYLKKLGTIFNYLATFFKAIGMSAATVITCNDFRLNNKSLKISILIAALIISFVAEITKFENIKINRATLRTTIAYVHSVLRALVMYQSLDHWLQHLLTAFKTADIGSMTQETLSMLVDGFQTAKLPLAIGFFGNIVAFVTYVVSNKRAIEQMFTPLEQMPSLSTRKVTLQHSLLLSSVPANDKLARAGTFVATHTTLSSFTALLNDVLLNLIITLSSAATDTPLAANNPWLIAACLLVMLGVWYLFKNVLNQANLTIYTNRRVRLFSLTYAIPSDEKQELSDVLESSVSYSSTDENDDNTNYRGLTVV